MGSSLIPIKTYFLTSLLLLLGNNMIISNTLVTLDDCNFPAIYNFGDSNSDTGAISATILRLIPPYGNTFFRKPAGRISDGRLIIDFIATNLSLPFVSAYVDSIGANYTHGANFAVAASTIVPSNGSIGNTGLSPLYLAVELFQFSQFIPRSQTVRNNQGGIFAKLLPKRETFSEALYTIDIGQNDIGDAFFSGMTSQQVKGIVPNLINTLSLQVQALYALGGRSIWIHNTGPIGCLAYILSRVWIPSDEFDHAGCGMPFNKVARYFNRKLKEEVVLLRKQLPLAAITYVDIYSIKYSFFSEPQRYDDLHILENIPTKFHENIHSIIYPQNGFVKPLVICCGTGGKYNYDPTRPCGVATSCVNTSNKVIWDGVHYTEAANKAVVDKIVTGKFSDPPIPPRLACHKFS